VVAVVALVPLPGSVSPAGASRFRPNSIGDSGLIGAAVRGSMDAPGSQLAVALPPLSRVAPGSARGTARGKPLLTGPGVRPGEQPPLAEAAMASPAASGAMAAAVYYVRALDWSIATNDTFLIRQLALPSCRACRAYVAQFSALGHVGGEYDGGRWRVKTVALVHGKSDIRSDYIVRVVADVAPARVVVGGDVSRLPGRNNVATYVFLSWVGHRWRVAEQTV
jgi:hypothetical protein